MLGDTRVIRIVEHKDDNIQWTCGTSIYTYAGEPENLKEAMTIENGHLWEMSAILDVKMFLSRKACILTNRGVEKNCNIRSEQFSFKKGLDFDKERGQKR